MPSITLPAELGISIIDYVGEDADVYHSTTWDAEYLRTLCICAIVCKDWLHRSRANLYWSIFIDDPVSFDFLKRTFYGNPSLRRFIRTVYVTRHSTGPNDDEQPRVPFHHALLFLRTIPSSINLSLYGRIPLDNVTRICLSLGYPHILHLRLNTLDLPINRVHHIINAFPSLRTVSYSEWHVDESEIRTSQYNIIGGGRASRLPEKAGLNPEKGLEVKLYHINLAHMLYHGLEGIVMETRNWAEYDAYVLDLPNFPLLRSLTIQLDLKAPHRSMEVVVNLLGRSYSSLHSLILILDGLFDKGYEIYDHSRRQIEVMLGPECHTLYRKIDDILGDGEHASENTVPSLTVKSTKELPRNIINLLTSALQSGFPKLRFRGNLKIDFALGGKEFTYYVDDIAISSTGKVVARTRKNYLDLSERFVVVCDSQTGTALSEIVASQALTFVSSPHGHTEDYILLVKEGSLVVWDHCCGADITKLDGPSNINDHDLKIWRVVHASTNLLVVCGTQGSMFVWDACSFALLYPPDLPDEEDLKVKSLNFICVSADEKWILMTNGCNSRLAYAIYVWNNVTRTLHADLSHHENHGSHCGPRVAAAFSEDGGSIIAVYYSGAVQRYDFRTGMLYSDTYLVNSVGNHIHGLYEDLTQLSPDGRRVCWTLADWHRGEIVNMSDTETGALLWSHIVLYRPSLQNVKNIFFSPDGQYVVVCGYSRRMLDIRRVVSGEGVIRDKWNVHVQSWGFSRNGRVLVVVSNPKNHKEVYTTEL